MTTDLKSHYRKLLEQYGPSPAAVQHISQESQFKRFEVLAEVDKNLDSVIDVGCGLGDMYEYLLQTKFSGRYLGLDFVAEFVALTVKNVIHEDELKEIFLMFDKDGDGILSIAEMLVLVKKAVAANAIILTSTDESRLSLSQ